MKQKYCIAAAVLFPSRFKMYFLFRVDDIVDDAVMQIRDACAYTHASTIDFSVCDEMRLPTDDDTTPEKIQTSVTNNHHHHIFSTWKALSCANNTEKVVLFMVSPLKTKQARKVTRVSTMAINNWPFLLPVSLMRLCATDTRNIKIQQSAQSVFCRDCNDNLSIKLLWCTQSHFVDQCIAVSTEMTQFVKCGGGWCWQWLQSIMISRCPSKNDYKVLLMNVISD